MKTGKSRLDILLNALSLLLLIGVPVWLAVTWGSIPDQIPQHYIASGAADRFGPKSGLITLQVIPWAAYLLFTAVQFLPRSLWNTGFAETEEERGQVCALTVHLINSVELAVTVLFAYCTVTSALAAGFSPWAILALLAAALGTLLYWLGKIIRVGKKR